MVLYTVPCLDAGPPKPPDDDHHAGSQYQTDSRGRSYHSTRGDSPLSAGPSTYHRAAQGAAERAAKSLFGKSFKGSHSISISVLGIIIEETSPELLADGASVMQDGITVIQETLLGQRSGAGGRNKMDSIDAYLICHVVDDVGQAVVRGALEHAGLVGYETNQVRCCQSVSHSLCLSLSLTHTHTHTPKHTFV